jgi:hypothetical protein
MARTRTIRLTTRDWTGDGIITVVAGLLVAVAVMLPWANDRVAGAVSWALTKPDDIRGGLGTPWGPPMLAIAVAIIALGVVMIVLGPHKLALISGALVAFSGIAVCMLALAAAREALGWQYAAGTGLMLALLVGILLIPIGVASAMVGFMLRRQEPAPEAPAA